MMKILKITIISLCGIALVFVGFLGFSFGKIYFDAKQIDVEFENNLDKFVFLEFFDANGEKADLAKKNFCSAEEILPHTFDAFVAREDRRFFSHGGIDFRGIGRAFVANIKEGSTVQGGSTITQQLAKNLVLSSDRKLSRKIAEVSLSRKIERENTKQEILTMYLNIIYFGENTFGIGDASMLYFGKSASKLSLSESAMLAGIIASPENYSPFKNYDKAVEKRNVVLKLMHDQGYISKAEYDSAIAEKVKVVMTKNDNPNFDYFNNTVMEASEVLGISQRQLCEKNYRIYTYIDAKKQEKLFSLGQELDGVSGVFISLDNESAGVSGVFESGHGLLQVERTPASLAKPLLVFAPALEENVIFSSSIFADEITDFGGYKPRNFLDLYYGNVSAKTALSKSLNVPAVKILESVGVEKSKFYASKMGLNFSPNDSGLSVALGGMYRGFSPLALAGGYMTIACGGEFSSPHFVREIQDQSGNIIFSRELEQTRVFGEDTAYILTDMMMECANIGTAKGLCCKPGTIGAKTGTNGDENGNIDAYVATISADTTFLCWVGNEDYSYMPSTIKGSTLPVAVAKEFLDSFPVLEKFKMPSSVCEIEYDKGEYSKNGRLLLAGNGTPKNIVGKTLIAKRFAPILKSTKYSHPTVSGTKISARGCDVAISFDTDDFAFYEIYDGKTLNLVAKIDGTGERKEICTHCSGDFAQFFIVATNSISGDVGERLILDKIYFEKSFLPHSS